jgi:SSS family solute:Na+ symporter
MYYKPGQYIANYAALTAAVFVAGAGVCIIGGLYWRRGTTTGAWTAMGAGIVCAGIALVAKEESMLSTATLVAWSEHGLSAPAKVLLYLRTSPKLSGQVLGFFAIAVAVVSYVVVSVFTSKVAFDLDRLLHRGKYTDAESSGAMSTEGARPTRTLLEKLGFTREFTGTDKWVTWVTLAWPLLWTVIFVVFTAYNLATPVPDRTWMNFWQWWTVCIFVLGIVVVIWFSIGGFRDLAQMYARLKAYRVDATDDGTVAESGDDLLDKLEDKHQSGRGSHSG